MQKKRTGFTMDETHSGALWEKSHAKKEEKRERGCYEWI